MGISNVEVTRLRGFVARGFTGKGLRVLVDAGRGEAVSEDGREVGAPTFTDGNRAAGDFYCADCGYGISLRGSLPTCPMCGGATWAGASRQAKRHSETRS
jgi:hypothetical protein